jgi:putative transcriptional regulator
VDTLRVLAFTLILVALHILHGNAFADGAKPAPTNSLTGKFLVAKPDMSDPRFRETVIFVARHDETGAFGLIVNRPLGEIEYATVVKNMGADPTGIEGNIAIFYGGPVDPKRGFILHSNDYPHPPLIPVNDRYGITVSTDIILALANGFGPKKSILAIGYAGWSEGQLEREIERNDWVIAPSDESILFDKKFETKWKRAYDQRFIDI